MKTNLYTIDEVAAMLRVSTKTVRRMIANDLLPGSFQVVRQWRIPYSAVERYLKALPGEVRTEIMSLEAGSNGAS